ncbi:hypothetical protein MMC25_007644 [Agyrium rufum]|nr:hypothetical protein [Agyrium rufum]
MPQCDPSLWILHYMRAEPQFTFPAKSLAIPPQFQSSMQQRRVLQQYGQLMRKEFMLHDRGNWPVINIPNIQNQQPGFSDPHFRGPISPYGPNQTMPTTIGPSPAKRQRQMTSSQRAAGGSSIAAAAMANDTAAMFDEEDVHRGDLMDLLTPRDISMTRYTQHHEWMEEIFSSPYATGQIVPVELGLGRKGELESLTQDFFSAPTEELKPSTGKTTVGPFSDPAPAYLATGKVEDFTERATAKLASLQAELEKMKEQHAKRLAKIGKNNPVRDADLRLQKMNINPSAAHTVLEEMDPSVHDAARGSATVAILRQHDKIDEIGREVQERISCRIERVEEVRCLEKGGLEEKTARDLHEERQMEALTANPIPPQLHAELVSTTPVPAQIDQQTAPLTYPPPSQHISQNEHPPTQSQPPPQQISNSHSPSITIPSPAALTQNPSQPPPDDWVMVEKQPTSQEGSQAAPQVHHAGGAMTASQPPLATDPSNDYATGNGGPATDQIPSQAEDAFDAGDLDNENVFDDTVDFGDMNTAGDELVDFEAQEETIDFDSGDVEGADLNQGIDFRTTPGAMGGNEGGIAPPIPPVLTSNEQALVDEDVDMHGMEDSAFGDAFLNTDDIDDEGDVGMNAGAGS